MLQHQHNHGNDTDKNKCKTILQSAVWKQITPLEPSTRNTACKESRASKRDWNTTKSLNKHTHTHTYTYIHIETSIDMHGNFILNI